MLQKIAEVLQIPKILTFSFSILEKVELME
jgi:hypothetical protein